MSSDNCAIESVFKDNTLIVRFRDAKILDEPKVREISKALTACLARVKNKKMLLNFDGVRFMSSDMISRLVLFNKKCRVYSVDLQLCNVPQNVLEVFRITRLDQIFRFYDGQDPLLRLESIDAVVVSGASSESARK
jgi:anti-anti-sigma factor